jgi:hypothetical protein
MTIGMTIAFALLLLHAAPDAFLQSGVVDGAKSSSPPPLIQPATASGSHLFCKT